MHMKGCVLVLLAERGPMWDHEIAGVVMQSYGLSGDYWFGTVRLMLADLFSSGLLTEVETTVDPTVSGDEQKLLSRFDLTDFGRTRMRQSGLSTAQAGAQMGAHP